MGYKIKLTGRNYLVPVTVEGRIVLLSPKEEQRRKLIPAFTDEEQFARLHMEGVRPELFSYERLKGLIVDDPENLMGILVNPFGEKILLTEKALEEIDRATQGMSVRKATHRGAVKVWKPSSTPRGLEEALENCFCQQGGIRQAWLFLMQGEGEEKPHWVLMLDFDGDRKTVFPPIAQTMRPFIQPGSSFELIKAEGPLGEHARQKESPFYCSRKDRAPVIN